MNATQEPIEGLELANLFGMACTNESIFSCTLIPFWVPLQPIIHFLVFFPFIFRCELFGFKSN